MLFAAVIGAGAEVPSSRPDLGASFEAINALGSRAEGTAGEEAAFEYIENSLRESGLEPSSSSFLDAQDGYSDSRTVEVSVKGQRDDELAVIVPVNSWIDSPEPSEGAYGLALALREARLLASRVKGGGEPCPLTLRFVFLGAEKRGRISLGETAALGSRTWIARNAGREKLTVLYLDAPSYPSRIELRSAGKNVFSPYWCFEGGRRALEGSGMDYDLGVARQQAYRLRLSKDYGPSAPYLEAGIPAIELRGDGRGEARDGGEWFDAFVRRFAAENAAGFPETWDRHYFIAGLGKTSIIVREKIYVASVVAFVAFVLLSFLVITVTRRRAAKRFLRRLPGIFAELVALFFVLALVFLAGKCVNALGVRLLGSAEVWRLNPRIFAAARIAFSLLSFLAVLSFLVEKRVLSPNPHFYEFVALVCLAADVLAFSTFDLSASFYFMWALFFVELSLALRRRWATLIVYVLMYLPFIIIAADLAASPDPSIFGRLLAPDFAGILALSGLTLPFFVFTASPLLFFAKPGSAARRRAAQAFALAAFAVEASALVYASLAEPSSGPRRRDLSISEYVHQDEGRFEVEVEGLRRLGKGSLERGGESFGYDSEGDRAYLSGVDRERRIGISAQSLPFLDRIDERVTVSFTSAPYSVDIALASEKEMLVYDCSLPCKLSVDGRSAVIQAAVNPGNELSFSLTVPASFRSKLTVTAHYLVSRRPFSQSSGSPLRDAGFSVRASQAIGGQEKR